MKTTAQIESLTLAHRDAERDFDAALEACRGREWTDAVRAANLRMQIAYKRLLEAQGRPVTWD